MSEKIPNDWWFIGIPDDLEYWNIEPRLKEHLEEIRTVYLFNRAEHTHCCELTPSYWLIAGACDGLCKPGTPEAIIEELDDIVRSVDLGESSEYRHVRNVEGMLKHNPDYSYQFGPDPEDEEPENIENAIIETWSPNPKF